MNSLFMIGVCQMNKPGAGIASKIKVGHWRNKKADPYHAATRLVTAYQYGFQSPFVKVYHLIVPAVPGRQTEAPGKENILYFYQMKFYKNKFSVVAFLSFSLFISSAVKAQSIEVKDYPILNSLNNITKDTRDTCLVTGFVNSIYNCPICPPGVICKPCIGNYLMIADTFNSKKQFRVIVKKTDNFSVGKKYILLVRLFKYNSEKEVYEGKLAEQD